MPHYAVTVHGLDRPGIVAALAWALAETGGNLEDVSSTSLRGHFAMLLLVDAPESRDSLRVRLGETAAALGVSATVRQVEEGSAERTPATHVLSVYGPDRTGIVAGLSRVLADRAVNITDLTCRTVSEEGTELYSMLAEVAVPAGLNPTSLQAELAAAATDLGIEISLEPIGGRFTGRGGPARSRTGPSG